MRHDHQHNLAGEAGFGVIYEILSPSTTNPVMSPLVPKALPLHSSRGLSTTLCPSNGESIACEKTVIFCGYWSRSLSAHTTIHGLSTYMPTWMHTASWLSATCVSFCCR